MGQDPLGQVDRRELLAWGAALGITTAAKALGKSEPLRITDQRIANQRSTTGRSAMSSLPTIWCGTSTHSGNALTVSPSPAVSSLVVGQAYCFVSDTTTTGPATLTIGTAPSTAITIGLGKTTAASLVSGNVYQVVYDGTALQVLGASEFLDVRLFGAKGDGTTDDTSAIQAAINAASSLGTADEGAVGSVYAPAGYTYKITSSLTINVPIHVDFRSFINLASSTPTSAVVIGSVAPLSGKNTGYRLYFSGFRDVNGNTSLPTGVNTSGSVGIRVHAMQFSTLEVGTAIAFTYCGIFLDCQDTSYSPQNVQQNTIRLGQIAYNGIGIYLASQSGTSSAGANRIEIQDVFSNFVNLQLDNPTTIASTSNTFAITAMDAAAPGGTAALVYSAYNIFEVTYLDGTFSLASSSLCNALRLGNNSSTLALISDAGTNNVAVSGPPNPGVLPATATITSGTLNQNNYGVPVVVYTSALLTPGTGTAYININVGPTSAPPVVMTAAANPTAAEQFPITLIVPPRYYWSITTGSGSAAFSTAHIYQSS